MYVHTRTKSVLIKVWCIVCEMIWNTPLARRQWNVNETLIERDVTTGCSSWVLACIVLYGLYGEAANTGFIGVLLLMRYRIFYFSDNPEISETSTVFVSRAELEPFASYRVFCARAKL